MRDRSIDPLGASKRLYASCTSCEHEILDLLKCVETTQTARQDLLWTKCALQRGEILARRVANRRPVGKVAVYLPSNLPLYSCYQYAIAPMLAGNAVTIHPSSQSGTVLQQVLALLLSNSDQLQVSNLPRAEFTSCVAMRADAVVITGNLGLASLIMAESQPGTVVIYQGAGINPFVINSDAQLDSAVQLAIRSRLFNSGQDCCASDCFYVHRSMFKAFVEALCDLVPTISIGPNQCAETIVGPLMRPDAASLLLEQARRDSSVKARIPATLDGSYCSIGVYECTWHSPIFRAEKFSPLFTLAPFDNAHVLLSHLALARHRMILTVAGTDSSLNPLRTNYGHFMVNTSIYEKEDAHIPFGGYGEATFYTDTDGHVVAGPLYIPSVVTKQRS